MPSLSYSPSSLDMLCLAPFRSWNRMRTGPVAAYLFGKGVKSIQGLVNTLDLNCNMGVDGAWKILESAAKHHDLLQLTVTEGFKRNGEECQPIIVGVDASIWMYQADRALTYGNTIQGPNPQLRILFYRIAYLLTFPIRVVFVFDGPARPEIKRGTNVLARGHPLTSPFQKLIEVFGYHWHTAPGEAEAELGQLSDLSIIDLVITTDIDALIFGARTLMIFPNKRKDKNQITLYTTENIFSTPGVSLTRGGLLLLALLAGGDYHTGIRGCGIGLAHAVARGGLGDSLLSKALEHPDDTPEFLLFLTTWKTALALEFATDPHGYLGSRRKLIAATINHTTSFPDLAVLRAYTHPITSWSPNYSPPAYQSWDLAQPDLGRMASFCQLQFGWNAGQVSSKFIKLVYSGIVLQSLLKPYDLHALLEAHVNSGFSSDGVFPRSSVLCVLEAKALSGSSLTQYRVEISTGALGLQVKPGLRDASAFPSATLMCTWIPASVIDYALPDLVSRSKSVANLKRKAKHSRKKPSASPARLHSVASAASAPVGGPSVFRREIIDLTSPEPELHL
ncbi:PIN domain-like protein [Mycena olivaceomarginata]|nr:PIN domain-like protein [Mycena olivaceomarginata]